MHLTDTGGVAELDADIRTDPDADVGDARASTIQERTCGDGVFDPNYSTCPALSCEQEPPLCCVDAVHGTTEERERYLVTSEASGDNCAVEAHIRACSNGDWTGWNGSFTELSCTFCGDSVVDTNEICDDGDVFDCGSCSADCQGDDSALLCASVAMSIGRDYSCALDPSG